MNPLDKFRQSEDNLTPAELENLEKLRTIDVAKGETRLPADNIRQLWKDGKISVRAMLRLLQKAASDDTTVK